MPMKRSSPAIVLYTVSLRPSSVMPSSLPGMSSLMTLPFASLNVMRRSGRSSTSAVMSDVFSTTTVSAASTLNCEKAGGCVRSQRIADVSLRILRRDAHADDLGRIDVDRELDRGGAAGDAVCRFLVRQRRRRDWRRSVAGAIAPSNRRQAGCADERRLAVNSARRRGTSCAASVGTWSNHWCLMRRSGALRAGRTADSSATHARVGKLVESFFGSGWHVATQAIRGISKSPKKSMGTSAAYSQAES